MLWTYLKEDLNGEEIVKAFYEKDLQKANQTEVKKERVITKKRW